MYFVPKQSLNSYYRSRGNDENLGVLEETPKPGSEYILGLRKGVDGLYILTEGYGTFVQDNSSPQQVLAGSKLKVQNVLTDKITLVEVE